MRIGYYAHHHGSGHCRQADKLAKLFNTLSKEAIAQPFRTPSSPKSIHTGNFNNTFTVFTSCHEDTYQFEQVAPAQIVRLPDEHEMPDDVLPGRAGQYWQPECMHYSPVGNVNIRARSSALLDNIERCQIELMIIDLSVEVALLCRAASIPYLYVRLPGDRNDQPHVNAFAGAIGLLAFYPKILESHYTPQWVVQKTLHLGFLPSIEHSPLADLKTDFMANLALQLAKHTQKSSERHSSCISSCHSRHQSNGNETCRPSLINQKSLSTFANLATSFTIKKTSKPQMVVDKNDKNNSYSCPPPSLADSSNQPPQLLHKKEQFIITIIKGYGGHASIDAKLPLLREALADAFIISLGPISKVASAYVDVAIEVDNVMPFLQYSDCIMMACGLNLVGEVCQFATPLVVIADERPHDEQLRMAQALIKCKRALSFDHFIAMACDAKPYNAMACDAMLNADDTKNILSLKWLPTPDATLQTKLQSRYSEVFVKSLVQAFDVKSWFYEWLLAKIDLQPEKLTL